MAKQTLNYPDSDSPEHGVKPSRSPRGSVQPSLLAAAREVFLERGYAGATTREIAQRAEASEPLLFRYFGSKANLFQVAVVEPFDEFTEQFSTYWTHREDHAGPDSPAGEFVRWLYANLTEARQTVLTLLTAHEHEQDLQVSLNGAGELLDRLAAVVAHETRLRQWKATNVPVATRVIVGMVAAAALGKDWLFAGDVEADDDEIIDEMVAFIVNGFTRAADQPDIELLHEPERGSLVIRGPNASAVTRAMHEWITERAATVEIIDLAWRSPRSPRSGDRSTCEVHVYYRASDP